MFTLLLRIALPFVLFAVALVSSTWSADTGPTVVTNRATAENAFESEILKYM